MSKRWLHGGVILGGVIAVFGFYDWAVAAIVFCVAAAFAQEKLDKLENRTRLHTRIESIR